MVIGALVQLITPVAVRAIGSHKRWVLGTAFLQAMSLLLLPVAAWLGSSAIWLVFVAASIYWACALGTGAVWNTWVEGMVPRPIRTRFFARRVRVCQASLLVGFLAGGFGLQIARNTPWGMAAFSLVFVAAALSRLMSVLFLYLQTERRATPMVERYVTIRDLGSGRKAASSARLLAYLFAAQIGVYIAGPFYAPYMLKKLQMPYHVFAILIGITFFGKVIALPFWGQLAHMAGPKKLLWVGGIGIIPVAGLWAVTQNVYFLCLLQFIGGITWAAYELAMFLMFLETIPREERTSVLTVYNLGNAIAQVTGALIGAVFLLWQKRTPEAYMSVFVLSSVGRALALPRGRVEHHPHVRGAALERGKDVSQGRGLRTGDDADGAREQRQIGRAHV